MSDHRTSKAKVGRIPSQLFGAQLRIFLSFGLRQGGALGGDKKVLFAFLLHYHALLTACSYYTLLHFAILSFK